MSLRRSCARLAVTNLDTILNLGWAVLCVGGVTWHWWWSRRCAPAPSRRIHFYRTLSVFLAAVSLFPCISASDDRVRLSDLDTGSTSGQALASGHESNYQLIAQLQNIEHGQTTTPFVFTPIFSSVLLVQPEQAALVRALRRDTPSRAPPAR
ncbi:MAG TPA: hypothetical protein VMB25_25105 [Bryobacteraceae bacterium]|nr:hypothetical protein [Bryobacteraceae bacterium]